MASQGVLLNSVFPEVLVEFGNKLEEVSENEETSIGGPIRRACVVACEDIFGIDGGGSWYGLIEANDKGLGDTILESKTKKSRVSVNKAKKNKASSSLTAHDHSRLQA